MNIIIETKKIGLDRSLKEYIEGRFGQLGKMISQSSNMGRSAKIWVEIGRTTLHHRKGSVFWAECHLRSPMIAIRASAQSDNLMAALNEVKEELQREIKHYNTKICSKARRGARMLKKEIHLSPLARFYRKGRIREEGI